MPVNIPVAAQNQFFLLLSIVVIGRVPEPIITLADAHSQLQCIRFSTTGWHNTSSEQRLARPARKPPEFTLHTVPTAIPHNLYSGDTLQARMLAEVKVSPARQVQPHSSYGQPNFYLKGESLKGYASIVEAIAAKLPSFKLIYKQTNWFLIWARSSVPTSSDIRKGMDLSVHEPNLYVDNVMVVGMSAGDRLMQLNPTLIDHIEVNVMVTASQGANGSSGLINVFTKKYGKPTQRDCLS